MTYGFSDLTDRQLFVSLMVSDRPDLEEVSDRTYATLSEEVDRRFGEGAADRLGSVTTATKMTYKEMLDWACEYPDQCVEAARTGAVEAFKIKH